MSAAPEHPHPNRLAFRGILTRVDAPSDRPLGGSRAHRVILTAAAAEAALPSLIGMGVGFKDGWVGHDTRQKCGVITHAELIDDLLHVDGYLFDQDFEEVAPAIRSMDMGMSYEMFDVGIDDMRAEVWSINRLTFTGAAILLRLKAAYHCSRITVTPESPRRAFDRLTSG